MFSEHGLHTPGDQGADGGLGPGIFQGRDHRGGQKDIAQMFELNDEDPAITHHWHERIWGPWPHHVWTGG